MHFAKQRERLEDKLVDDAFDLMERDRKAEEAEKASARLLVGALVRAAEKEGDADGNAD